jgi:uncharacterized protein (DUF3820 family)
MAPHSAIRLQRATWYPHLAVNDDARGEKQAEIPQSGSMGELLEEVLATKMPFGRYAGTPLMSLPEPYLTWFANKGFPQGKLGQQLALVHEIKINGLEALVRRAR